MATEFKECQECGEEFEARSIFNTICDSCEEELGEEDDDDDEEDTDDED